jgi:hypothetical protein
MTVLSIWEGPFYSFAFQPSPAKGPGDMTNTTMLITDMAILAGILLLGLLAKLFPKRGGNARSKQ